MFLRTAFIYSLSFAFLGQCRAGSIRGGSRPAAIGEDLYRRVLKIPDCGSGSVNGKQGYYTTEIMVTNVTDNDMCQSQISSVAMGQAIDKIATSVGLEMIGSMAAKPSLRSSMCSKSRRLDISHSTGWLWGGGGHTMFCGSTRGMTNNERLEQTNQTGSLTPATSDNLETDSALRKSDGYRMETVDGSDFTFDSILWNYRSLLKTRIFVHLNETVGDTCFEPTTDVDCFITPVGSLYEATMSDC